MIRPDYQNNTIVNLMATLGKAMGYDTGHPQLTSLDVGELSQSKHIVLWVIDGLGYDYLRNKTDSFLYQNLQVDITSVFPSTTATAISSFMTAQTPGQHGMTGWFMYLAKLGLVSAILPYVSRAGGMSLKEGGLHIDDVLGLESVYSKLDRKCFTLSPSFIVDSPFNVMATKGAKSESFNSMSKFSNTLIKQVSRCAEKSYHYAYWSELDSIGHNHGIGSDMFNQHFSALDQMASDIALQLQGTDTVLIICADHGQINTAADRVINITQDHPELESMLLLPLCGEPRAAYCYVQSGRYSEFEEYIRQHLADKLDIYKSTDLLENGWYGTVADGKTFCKRIGDYVLVPRENYVIKDRLPGERAFYQVGTHGGMSEAEMLVPLIKVNC